MLFSDGRYTLQMESQKASGWDCATMPEAMPEDWLLTHHRNRSLGFDPDADAVGCVSPDGKKT